MVKVAGVAHLGLYSAYLFMAHLYAEAVVVEYLQCLLKSRRHRSRYSLPVLLLEFLSYRKLVSVCPVIRCLDPELQLGRVSQHYVVDLIDTFDTVDVLKHIWMLRQFPLQLRSESLSGFLQVYPCSDQRVTVVEQERRDPKSAYRQSCLVVHVVVVVFDEPLGIHVRHQVDSRVGEIGDGRKSNGRAVGLDASLQQLFHVIKEERYRDLLIGIVASHVDARERHELDFRVSHETTPDGL